MPNKCSYIFSGLTIQVLVFKVLTGKNQMERHKVLRLWLLMGEKYLRLFH